MSRPADKPFKWAVRVYYEDTDAAGVVYHAAHLRFFERARTEWLRHLGFSQRQLLEQYGLLFVLATADIRWLRPTRLDDELTVSAQVLACGKVSIEFDQRIVRCDGDSLLVQAKTRVGCIDAVHMKPRRLPANILAEIAHDG